MRVIGRKEYANVHNHGNSVTTSSGQNNFLVSVLIFLKAGVYVLCEKPLAGQKSRPELWCKRLNNERFLS